MFKVRGYYVMLHFTTHSDEHDLKIPFKSLSSGMAWFSLAFFTLKIEAA
jgi:hypothetical protein